MKLYTKRLRLERTSHHYIGYKKGTKEEVLRIFLWNYQPELGLWTNEKYRNQGYMVEALKAVCLHFNMPVIIRTEKDNYACQQAAQNAEFFDIAAGIHGITYLWVPRSFSWKPLGTP